MNDDKIDVNQHRIQKEHDCHELQCAGKRNNADYNKEYKEQSRESLGFFTATCYNKELEKENNDTTALCDKNESYELK